MKFSITEYKEKMQKLISSALKSKWITVDDSETLISQMESDMLSIGVVGQMKVGKSTLINALIFGEELLPTSEIPMTAALTYITFGEKFCAKVENITEADFLEIENKVGNSSNFSEEEVESATNIYKNIVNVDNYKELLGKNLEITKENLFDYIGAGGKYTALVKYVTLEVNNNALKGINIVDTPGYNDPISSRDLTTKKFLSKANVILLVQDVEQVFSKLDIDLITSQIPKSGIGKVVVAINKKDAVSKDELNQVIVRANDVIQRLSSTDDDVSRTLLESCQIIPLSGLMAIIGQLDDGTISGNDNLSFFNSLLKCDFPLLKKEDYVKESGLIDLQHTISDLILNQKKDILLKAPYDKLISMLQVFVNKCNIEKESLEQTNEYLSDQQIDLNSILDDLNTFELQVIEYMSNTISNCESITLSKLEQARYSLRDKRDAMIKSINFEEKHNKKYLRVCFNEMEDKYHDLNISFGNILRRLGNDISDAMHDELASLEQHMNHIILKNAQLIHSSVIRRITRNINNTIPRTVGQTQSMNVVFPDYWDRQDLFQVGIRSYFRQMLMNSFDNMYINSITSTYEDVVVKILDVIEKEITLVIEETKKQFDVNSAAELQTKIDDNIQRINYLENEVVLVNQYITKISDLYKSFEI
jgi:GTP-binding protein EngB required for normal cell division